MKTIVIIGAGASGLMAGCELIKKYKDVIILEGRARIGGRMNTITDKKFTRPVEEGAEFIHGDLPLTLSVLSEAEINYNTTDGKVYQHDGKKITSEHHFIHNQRKLTSSLKKLEEDMTVEEFLLKNFDEENDKELIDSVRRFVEGYDSADYKKASALSFKEEWLSDDDNSQHRIEGGYERMYNYLASKFKDAGGRIILNKIVNQINWNESSAVIKCADNKTFPCDKVLVTVSTGVLKGSGKESLNFIPEIPQLINWKKKSGFGNIIKIIIEFTHTFWEKNIGEDDHETAKGMGFMFSKEIIPTWWTQLPDKLPLLTGWLGGPSSCKLDSLNENEILGLALKSLSELFTITEEELKKMIVDSHVKNWNTDPFSKGAYAYRTPETLAALKEFEESSRETVYFAGEAFYEGKEMGTVEAALVSGLNAAKII